VQLFLALKTTDFFPNEKREFLVVSEEGGHHACWTWSHVIVVFSSNLLVRLIWYL